MDLFVKAFAGPVADDPSKAAMFRHLYASQGYVVLLSNPRGDPRSGAILGGG